MRRLVLASCLFAACSGGKDPEPEASRASPEVSAPVAEPAGAESGGEAEPDTEPEPAARLVESGETDGEMQAMAGQGEDETGATAQGRPTEAPPPAEGEQPPAPDAEAGPPADANLDPEHLQQVREQDMTERERRAERARNARKAYEQ